MVSVDKALDVADRRVMKSCCCSRDRY